LDLNSNRSELGGIFFLALVGVFLVGVVYYNQSTTVSSSGDIPGLSISDFQVLSLQGVNSTGTILLAQFTVKDDTPVGGTVENASYNLYADGGYVGRGVVNTAVVVPARGSVIGISVFLVPLAGSLRGTWSYFVDGGDVSWHAVGNATISQSVLGTVRVQFNCNTFNGTGSISCNYVLH
jgi:hypothetical protein